MVKFRESDRFRVGPDCYVCVGFRRSRKRKSLYFKNGETILEMSELGLDHDPLLFLSILGSALPGVLASLDTTGLANAFLGIA